MKTSNIILKSALVLAMALPVLAMADSQLVTSTATSSPGAVANLKFSVIIPKVLSLQVGPAGTGASNITTLTFDYTAAAATVGNSTPSAAQGVTVSVLGNNGTISLSAAGSGTGLVGTDPTDIIAWTKIAATTGGTLPVPTVGNAAIPVTVTSGKLTVRSGTWNYSYANDAVVPSGTYTGQITYTATML
jgi:hypothetical protein